MLESIIPVGVGFALCVLIFLFTPLVTYLIYSLVGLRVHWVTWHRPPLLLIGQTLAVLASIVWIVTPFAIKHPLDFGRGTLAAAWSSWDSLQVGVLAYAASLAVIAVHYFKNKPELARVKQYHVFAHLFWGAASFWSVAWMFILNGIMNEAFFTR